MSSLALPYHEPGIVDILTLSSFLLILNAVSSVMDCYLYCGLIGQILIGIAWGAPGAAWLSIATQETITQLGYLGLILLVFEGGLSTSLSAVKTNMLLSVAVATVGMLLPMALSFSLIGIADATPLQAFAAGAALCSTSLGTTFTLLSSSGLVTSRLGVVLSSAAMLDDVVGLVMVQIISNLGTSSSVSAVTVVRPILVSIAFATILPTFCFSVVRPAIRSTFWHRQQSIPKWMKSAANGPRFAFVIQALLLIAFVTGASYAGTSNLFTAYLAGATISWWGAENAESNHSREDRLTTGVRQYPEQSLPNSHEKSDNTREDQHEQDNHSTGAEIYTQFVEIAVRRILKPFFFASIGFSIPISRMFSGFIVWRGILYSIMMVVGKLACGLGLLPLRALIRALRTGQPASKRIGTEDCYPSFILGFAMVARGEIGFLISSIAESEGVFSGSKDLDSRPASDLLLIVSWAIVICTILGPICVGLFVWKIQNKRAAHVERHNKDDDAWGIWGVKPS